MKIIGVFGASGFGREVLPLVRQSNAADVASGKTKLYFVDDSKGGLANGVEVLTFDAFSALEAESKSMTIGIASATVRQKLEERCVNAGIDIIDVRADNVVVLDEVSIGPGSILCPFVCLTSNIVIGRQFQANLHSYVGHDCTIGDYVTFAPAVCCNGNIVIEDFVYVGTGAVIKQGEPGKPLVLGKGSVIGMGAVVTKSVAPGAVVVGNPARPMERKV